MNFSKHASNVCCDYAYWIVLSMFLLLGRMRHIMYLSIRLKKENLRKGGSKLNCCKIWPPGKHDYLLNPELLVKVLAIAERGLSLVMLIVADVEGRDEERG